MFSGHNSVELQNNTENWEIQKYMEIKHSPKITNGPKKKSQRKWQNKTKQKQKQKCFW